MKTNQYLERYMRTNNIIHNSEDTLDDMCWGDKLYGLRIVPEHFNYFYFNVFAKERGSTLTVESARELAKWLLEVTDGLEDTSGIMQEMLKRQ